MIGTPYWGDSTFLNTHELLNHANKHTLNTKNTVDNTLSSTTLKEGVLSFRLLEDMYVSRFGVELPILDVRTLIYVLSKLEFMFVIQDMVTNKNFLTWCKDTRFNYRDGELFIPYYTYDTVSVPYINKKESKFVDMVSEDTLRLRYDYEIKKHILHRSKDIEEVSPSLDELFVLYNKDEHAVYSLDIVDLPLLSSRVFSLDELKSLYEDACYAEVSSLRFLSENTYFGVNDKVFDKVGKAKRSRYHLPLYKTKFTPLLYTDLRMYTYRSLKGVEEPKNPVFYWERTMLFESLLYSIFAVNVEPEPHPSRDAFKQLGVTLRHVKIGNGEPSLILKHYYKNNSQLKLKSFEWR